MSECSIAGSRSVPIAREVGAKDKAMLPSRTRLPERKERKENTCLSPGTSPTALPSARTQMISGCGFPLAWHSTTAPVPFEKSIRFGGSLTNTGPIDSSSAQATAKEQKENGAVCGNATDSLGSFCRWQWQLCEGDATACHERSINRNCHRQKELSLRVFQPRLSSVSARIRDTHVQLARRQLQQTTGCRSAIE